jgi:hypothetical protein
MRISLSKSLYTKGLQCHKALWLKKYNKAVLTPPNAATMARFKEGNVVGDFESNSIQIKSISSDY